jgi:hypothetical protein
MSKFHTIFSQDDKPQLYASEHPDTCSQGDFHFLLAVLLDRFLHYNWVPNEVSFYNLFSIFKQLVDGLVSDSWCTYFSLE